MKYNTTAAHGTSFQQTWIGAWKRYSATPFIAAARRPKSSAIESGLGELVRMLDQSVFHHISHRLRKADKPVYNGMRVGQQDIARAVVSSASKGKGGTKTFLDMDESRKLTSSFRMGGLGTMLAISKSSAGGTDWHYDKHDDSKYLSAPPFDRLLTRIDRWYSTIVVLKTSGVLLLPETGYAIECQPGDAVCFLASQQLHKLTVESDDPDAEQLVFTVWTDKETREFATPGAGASKDFYPATEMYLVDPENDDVGEGHGDE
jgi:hypothetical protein